MKKQPLIIFTVIILSLTAYIFHLKSQINSQSSAEINQDLHAQCSAEAARLKTEIDSWMKRANENADEAKRQEAIAIKNQQEANQQRAIAEANERKAVENEMKARDAMKHAEEQMKLAMQNQKMAQQTIAQLQEKLKGGN